MNVFRELKPADGATILNALLGFSALLMASRADGSFFIEAAVVLILLAAVSDGIDGFLARRWGSSPLGADLDSLADLTSFGVAPAFLATTAFREQPFVLAASLFYLLASLLRLARFNASPKDEKFFEGLPVPAASILLAASVLYGQAIITSIIMLVLAVLMVSSAPYPKVRDIRALFLMGLTILAAASLIWRQVDVTYAAFLIIAVILIYIISPVVASRLRKGK
ncbi:MAG TPA: CDP-diacylglycerol--serine O-phosphatidyltransferase [Methanothrix sp.]|nr:CDP-diacylglycerol--serine O-phosphatidyltransferase [Methanothrix sp.]